MSTPVSNQYFAATAWANKGWGSIYEPKMKEVREPKYNFPVLSLYKPEKQVENPNGGIHFGRLITTFLKSVTLTPFAIVIDVICDLFKVTIGRLATLIGKVLHPDNKPAVEKAAHKPVSKATKLAAIVIAAVAVAPIAIAFALKGKKIPADIAKPILTKVATPVLNIIQSK